MLEDSPSLELTYLAVPASSALLVSTLYMAQYVSDLLLLLPRLSFRNREVSKARGKRRLAISLSIQTGLEVEVSWVMMRAILTFQYLTQIRSFRVEHCW